MFSFFEATSEQMPTKHRGLFRQLIFLVLCVCRVHHQHLVQLLGYCTERGERILVYEYMAEGNLRFNLARKQRKENTSSEGLRFLHNNCPSSSIQPVSSKNTLSKRLRFLRTNFPSFSM